MQKEIAKARKKTPIAVSTANKPIEDEAVEKLKIDAKDGDNEGSDDEDIVGPMPPQEIPSIEQSTVPKEKKNDDESTDSYDDLSDSEDDEESIVALAKKIPASHEVAMVHGTRSILALASDPSGARIASGSIDSR